MQGRMGRTGALRNGSQDEVARSLNLWNFALLGFCEVHMQTPAQDHVIPRSYGVHKTPMLKISSLVVNPDVPTHSALAPEASRACSSLVMPLFTVVSPSSTRRPVQNQRRMLPRTTQAPSPRT